MTLTLEQVREKTLDMLNSTNPLDVQHITEELISSDSKAVFEEAAISQAVYEGHNVRYAYNNGQYGYAFERGGSPAGAGCGNSTTTWVPFDRWHATAIGVCSGNDHLVRFTMK